MSFWKKLGKIVGAVVAVAAVVFAGPAIAAVAGAIGATGAAGMAAAGALYGAAAGAVAGGLWTGNSSGMAKGAAIGGLIGGAAGAVGVGTSGGAFGSGIGASGAAPVAAPPAATTPSAAAQTTKGLSSVTFDEATGSAVLPNPTGSLDAASKVVPTGTPEITKVSSALDAAQSTGKYMMYAEGIKLVAGGIAGAAASKERASELEAANAKDEELKNNRNYQPAYKSNTIFAEKKTTDPKRYFGENGLLNPVSKVG